MSRSRVPGPELHGTTETLVRTTAVPRPLGALVVVHDADAHPAQLRLPVGTCVLGSAPDCDVVIREPTVSRRHAELRLAPEGVLVRDLESYNGVFYQDQRVERMVLAFGGRIRLGAVTVSIDVDLEALQGETGVHPQEVYRGMVGPSLPMRRVFAVLERLEGSLVTVLVEGESGVGKELIAAALHHGSSVSTGPLVAVNCGAIAQDLVASELFGHRRGAFTGAMDARHGAFASADGGTLFLDEIGELPLAVQPMLLRVLESGEVRPVGGDDARRVRVRVVAATNRDLEEEVDAGRFREDLYYRLAVVKLAVPPLRDRADDIPALARHFARQVGLPELSPDVIARLQARSWWGNVRELRNAIEAYAALGSLPAERPPRDGALESLLAKRIDVTQGYAGQKDALVDRFTRLYLEALMAHTGGNQTTAAELAGLGRTYLNRLLQKHGVGKRDRRG